MFESFYTGPFPAACGAKEAGCLIPRRLRRGHSFSLYRSISRRLRRKNPEFLCRTARGEVIHGQELQESGRIFSGEIDSRPWSGGQAS
jgi:hypothetical protein